MHEGYLTRLFAEAARNGTLDDPDVADALVDAYVSLVVLRTHNWRTLSKLARGDEPGPESSWVKLTWSDMTQQLSEAALAVEGPASGCGDPGNGSGCGPRPPASPAARRRCSAT